MGRLVDSMRAVGWIVVALIAATALAGCTSTPTDTKGKGTATSVTVTGYPEHPDPNSDAIVCWRVAGSGNIAHTAVHYGPDSHPGSSAKFSDYPNTIYPDNATAADPNGYNLPGSFCARIHVGAADVYFRAHYIDSAGGNGQVSDEKEMSPQVMTPTPPSTVVAVTFQGSTPDSAAAGTRVPVCWTVTGTGKVAHTAIHTDTATHRTSNNFEDYKGNTSYPNDTPVADPNGYSIPGTFCANVTMPSSGTLYLRAHAMLPPPPPGMLSAQERAIQVNETGNMTGTNGVVLSVAFGGSSPSPSFNAPHGTMVNVCWNVTGAPGHIPHTAVHTDTTSHIGDSSATFETYLGQAYYPGGALVQDPNGYSLTSAQTQFCTDIPAPATAGQILYIRAHAMDAVTGAPGMLSTGEGTITAS
jgi:hypothetical protein